MKRAWLFNPENDIALSRNVAVFTAPPAARALARAGRMLPMWIGRCGDVVINDGVNARWLATVAGNYGLEVAPWNHTAEGYEPTPWGWSAATRRFFSLNGFPDSVLPDDARLEAMRQLSHRRTAAAAARLLAGRVGFEIWPAAVEVTSDTELAALLAGGDMVVKAPWSSSGRGISFSTPSVATKVVARVAGTIKSQGSVMVERAADRVADFAMLFEAGDAGCRFCGLSLFKTMSTGEYVGNVVAPQEELRARIAAAGVDMKRLDVVCRELETVLAEVIDGRYAGPVGVDMLLDRSGMLHPVVEINFRYTMGFVALALESFAGAPAVFSVRRGMVADAPVVRDGRLVGGTQLLTPPDPDFSFVLEIQG